MRRLHSQHPLHRALCALLCVVLALTGGLRMPATTASGGGCATAHACCCGNDRGCELACLCEAPSTPPKAPAAPGVAPPSLVELATPPDTEPVVFVPLPPVARPTWQDTMVCHALAARARHVALCVFLC